MSRHLHKVLLAKNPSEEILNKIIDNINHISYLQFSNKTDIVTAYIGNFNPTLFLISPSHTENYKLHFGLEPDNTNNYSILFYIFEEVDYKKRRRFSRILNKIFKELIKGLPTENLAVMSVEDFSGSVSIFHDEYLTSTFKGVEIIE